MLFSSRVAEPCHAMPADQLLKSLLLPLGLQLGSFLIFLHIEKIGCRIHQSTPYQNIINGLTPWCRRPPFGGPWLSDVMRCYPTCFHICHVCPLFSPVQAHSWVLCPDGPCFTQVLTPSKWSKATWPGAGKGLPLQGNVFAVT